jgi:hypothetical protein
MTTSHTMPPSRWRRQRRLFVLAAVIPLGLGLVACGDDDEDEASTAQGAEDGDNGSGGGGGDAPSVEITSPADGDTIGSTFDLELSSSEEIGEPDTGRLHFHVFVDGDEEDYEIAYEESVTVDRDLSEGEHTIEAALANPDHSLVDDAPRDEITVTVGNSGASGAGAGGSGDSSSTTPTSGDDGGYDY